MDRRRRLVVRLVLAFGLLAGTGFAQLAPCVASDLASASTFTRTRDNDWRTTIRTARGDRDYVYVPGNRLFASVRTRLAVANTQTARFTFTWRFVNDARSTQELNQVAAKGVATLVNRTAAPGWHVFVNDEDLLMFGPVSMDRDAPSGIRPGHDGVFEFEARARLPAPMRLMAVGGDVPPLPEAPAELSDEQRVDLRLLGLCTRTTDVELKAIGPAIPIAGESDVRELARRVSNAYATALIDAAHPLASDLAQALNRVATAKAASRIPVLQELRVLTGRSVVDPWHRELSRALELCTDYLIASGKAAAQ